MLLNDDLPGARKTLEAQRDSPYALAGLGICEFLTAAISLEDERLHSSMDTLSLAEKAAKKSKTGAENDPGQWWIQTGLEYEVLLADVVAAQSLLHLLGDSYFEYAKAMWKLNSSFKYFTTIYKAVFPQDVKPDATVQSIIDQLNERYKAATLSSSLLATSHNRATMGKLKSMAPKGFSSTTPDLLASGKNGANQPGLSSSSSSIPASTAGSVGTASPPNEVASDSTTDMYNAAWTASPIVSFIVSGGAFGHGLFELVFALLPPKGRKLFSWLGYGTGDRRKALKLLEVTARTGSDIHASFAALTLVSYYCAIFLMSGWQCERAALLASCDAVLTRSTQKHPNGTLWLLNGAKLARMKGQVNSAHDQLQLALSRPSTFRQAMSTLQFELSWVLLSRGDFVEASASFAKMIPLNSWSHSTYWALAAGCLQEFEGRTPEQDESMRAMYLKIPGSFNRKRFMGQPPSSEIYLEKRLKFYKNKTERWISAGKLQDGADWIDSIRISVALELSLYWNQFAHYPSDSLQRLQRRLEGLLKSSADDLDTPEEVALCHTLLGTCALALADFSAARHHLKTAEDSSSSLSEAYTYISALAKLFLATLECREAEGDTGRKDDKAFWTSKLTKAESKLDEVFGHSDYDMNGRIESRGQMMRVEIAEKKRQLGL